MLVGDLKDRPHAISHPTSRWHFHIWATKGDEIVFGEDPVYCI